MAKIPEINLTDNVAENIVKMAPYLDEKSQHIVFGMMLEAVRSLEDVEARKAGWEPCLCGNIVRNITAKQKKRQRQQFSSRRTR